MPKEALSLEVVYPIVLLAHGHSLNLLLAMVYSIQNRLRMLTNKFCKVKKVCDKDGSSKTKTLNPRIELPYTYLMASFMLHCPN